MQKGPWEREKLTKGPTPELESGTQAGPWASGRAAEPEHRPDPEPEPKPKGGKWKWLLGGVLLLAVCSGDDDDRRKDRKRHCYVFGEEPDIREACFADPLPESARCTFVKDGGVECSVTSG